MRALTGAAAGALLVMSALVIATEELPGTTEPLTGTLSGSFQGTEACAPDFEPEDFSGSVSLQCTQAEDGSFQCSGTAQDEEGTSTLDLQGSNIEGQIGGVWDFTDPLGDAGGGSFGGFFDGNIVQLFLSGSSSQCEFLSVEAQLDFSGVSGERLRVGENTDPASGTSAANLSRTVTGQVNTISSYAKSGLQGGRRSGGGISPSSSGLNMRGTTGLNAGEGLAAPVGAWFNYTYSDFDDDFAATAFDATRHSFLGGVDFNPFTPVLMGLAFGYETADYDTDFNAGEQDTDGWTISPYLAASLSDTFSIDAVFGYSDMDTDQFRTAGDTRITSDFGADRFFWGGNLNMVKPWGNWYLTGSVGFIWAREFQDEFTESNGNVVPERTIKLGQWHLTGEAAYSYGNWEPFAAATFSRDYQLTEIEVAGPEQPANDRDDVVLGLGLRYYHPMGVSASVEWNKRLGREDFDEDTINVLLRMDF